MPRTAGAAVTLAAASARPAIAIAAVRGRPAVTAATATATAAGADTGELLDGLAGDVRVIGEAQADAAPLAVDLDDLDVDLVALVEHVLDGLDALAGRDV